MALVFMFLLLSLFYFLLKIIINKSKFEPPGPPGLPFLGNLHQIDSSSPHTFLWQLSKTYGPIISLQFGFIPNIVVSSSSLAKEVMKTQDIIFCSRPLSLGQRKLSYNGIDIAFGPHNDTWREMRKVFTLHLFSPKRVKSLKFIREEEVSSAMKKIRVLARSSKRIKLRKFVKSVTNNIMMRVTFGMRYKDGHERKKVLQLLNELQVNMMDFYFSDAWAGLPFVGSLIDRFTGKIHRLEKCFQDFDSFYQEFIDEHVNLDQNSKSNEEEEDVIDILLRLMKDKLFNISYDHIKAMLMNVLAGGTDTSASTVVWAMASLMKNPKVMKKAQDEVRNVVGEKGKIDEDDLSKLTYLKAVIKEIMRLYPPAPLLIPRETKKDVIINGYKIKQKTTIHINIFAIGRDPEFWENPDEFLPERFLGSDIEFKGNDFELLPFGAGRRICPGISMGVVMVELLLANLLYLFDWELSDGMKREDIDFDFMSGITMFKRNELCLLAQDYM